MRKPFRNILLALVAIAILGGMIWRFTHMPPKEPIYKGKPLTYWLSGYGFPTAATTNWQRGRDEAEEAVKALGTNCIPTLLRLVAEPDTPSTTWLVACVNRLGRKWHWNWLKLKYPNPAEKNIEAYNGFQALGPQQINLVPELTRIYELNGSSCSRQVALATATVVSPQSKDLIPLIFKSLGDTNDFFLRADGAVALGKIHAPPELAVPALMKTLQDSNETVRVAAIYALGEFGAHAEPALPALQKILEEEEAKGGNSKSGPWAGFGFCFGNMQYFRSNSMRTSMRSPDVGHAADTAISQIKGTTLHWEVKEWGGRNVTKKETNGSSGLAPW